MPTHTMFKTSAASAGNVMNIDRARNQLGFEPEFPMPAAVADYIAWLREIS
jgi:nucleoside-diphosphate-sugar epimerase